MEQTFPNQNELRNRFLALLREQVGRGVYVWGGNGELLDAMDDPERWIRRHESNAADANRAIALYRKRRQAGVERIRAFDCSGLIYWALRETGVQKTDVSSRGLYALCKPIGEDELKPGDLVFHHNGERITHVGVCDGREQIECKGRDEGVVKNARRHGYWNRFGRLSALPDTDAQLFVLVKGNSVRVRAGDGVRTPCIGIAHKNDRLPLLSTAPSGWYCIEWNGRTAFITNRSRYTEVRHG